MMDAEGIRAALSWCPAELAAPDQAAVPAVMYRHGRKHFLERLLACERIYLSEYFHCRLDERARANLGRALTAIQ